MMTFENVLKKEPLFDKIKSFLELFPKYEVYVVGGFVRDAFLQETNKDIDIVVVAEGREKVGITFAKELAKFLDIDSVQYFENFGTAAFNLGDTEIEIVGARKESYERGSRKPIVE